MIVNDLVKPTTMSKEKVQSIIEEKLHVSPTASPSLSVKSTKSNDITLDIKESKENKTSDNDSNS